MLCSGPARRAAQQAVAADAQQLVPFHPWYRSGGGRLCPCADGQRSAVQLNAQPLGGRSVELEGLLQTHAEVGVALAGFASVVAALRRPLSTLARQRFLSLLALSVIQILGCLLPIWFMHGSTTSELEWRVLSALLLVLYFMRMWWLVLLPARHVGVEVRAIITPAVGRLVWGAGLAAMLLLLLNIAGLPLRPGFDLYYASLLSTLLVGFVLFADVAVGDT